MTDANTDSIYISVVMPVYNGKLFLVDALKSVEAELGSTRYEIICVDDCSTDNSYEIVSKKFSSVTLIRNKTNTGFAETCNTGFKQASGEYVLLLNQDTRIHRGAITALLERLRLDERIAFIGPKFVGFDGCLQKNCSAFPSFRNLFYRFFGLSALFPASAKFSAWDMRWFDHETEMVVDQPMGAALLFRRSLIEELGYLDERFPMYLNDVDIARRAVEAGYYNLYYPNAVIEHFVGGSTKPQKPRMVLESHRSLYRYLKKWNNGAIDYPLLAFWKIFLGITGRLRSLYWKVRA